MKSFFQALERRMPFLLAVLGIFTLIVFICVLGAEFVNWDDPQLVYDNPLVRLFSPAIFWTFDPELYIPLTLLSYQIEHAFFGFDPFIFHLTSLILHTGSVLLVFLLFDRLLGKRWLAFASAFLFAVHPLNTEAVAWVSARKDVLSTFLFLLSIVFYLRSDGGARKWFFLSLLSFLFALLAKISVVTLPIVLLLIDHFRGKNLSLHSAITKWPYFLLSVIFGIVALFGKAGHLSGISLIDHLLLSVKSFAFAITKLFVPADLSVLYPQTTAISLINPEMPVFLLVIAAFVGLCILVRKNRELVAVLLVFFITFLPSILTFVKSGGIYFFSDRYTYIPSVWAVLFLALLIKKWSSAREHIGVVILAVIILIMVPLTWIRTGVWHDTETLFGDVLLKHPQAQAAHTNLGEHFLRGGNMEQAEKYLESSLAISSAFAIVHNNLGLMYMQQGRMSEALEKIETAIAIDGSYGDAYVNLGVWYGKSGNLGKAEEALLTAIELEPSHAQALFNLAGVYQSRGEIDRAVETYEKVLELDKRHRNALIQLSKLRSGE